MSTSTLGLFLRHLVLSEEVNRLGNTSDQDLLTTYESGRGQAAFAELMRRHGPMVLRTCRRVLGRGPDAEDAFQATFVLLACRVGSISKREALGGWLHRVAYRTALDVLTKLTRRRAHEQQASTMIPSSPDPSAEATWNEIRPILDAELDALPEQARRLLIACYLQGKTHAEAAAELGLPPGSLAWRLDQARALLATRLVRRGVTVSSALLGVLLGDLASGAGVPAVLVVHTLEGAITFNEKITGAVSARVAHLVKGGLANMTWSSTIKFNLVLACCLGLAGAGLIACRALSARPEESERANTAAEQASSKADQGGQEVMRLDRQGEPLPKGALARLGRVGLYDLYNPEIKISSCHMGWYRGMAFSPDGKIVAVGGEDGRVHLGEVASGKQIRTLHGRKQDVYKSVAFSPDGKIVAGGAKNDKTVRLWEAATGQEIRILEGHEGPVNSVAFSPDGKTVASGGADGTIRLWEVATGKAIHTMQGAKERKVSEVDFYVNSVAFSHDGKMVTSGDGLGNVRLWKADTGKEIRTMKVWKESIDRQGGRSKGRTIIFAVAFSPNDEIVAAGTSIGTRLWETATGKEIRTLKSKWPVASALYDWVVSVVFSPDGRIMATKEKPVLSMELVATVRLWETATGKEIYTLKGTAGVGGYDAVAFSPDGKTVATGVNGGSVRRWNVLTGKLIRPLEGHLDWVMAVAFLPDGKTVLTGEKDGTRCVWEATTGKQIRMLQGDKGGYRPLAFSSDGKLVATAEGTTVHLGEAATGEEIRTLKGIKGEVVWVTLSPDGKTVATGERDSETEKQWIGTIRLWETATGKEILARKSLSIGMQGGGMVFSHDGKTMARQDRRHVPVVKLADGKVVERSEVEIEEVSLWEAATGKKVRTLEGDRWHVLAVAFSPDGKTVAMGNDDGVGHDSAGLYLWEAATGKKIRTLYQGPASTFAVAFSHDGRTLAAGLGNGAVRLWDLSRDAAPKELVGHRGAVLGLAFSPNDKTLVSVSADATGLVWDLTYDAKRPAAQRDSDLLQNLWTDLASEDAVRAMRAVAALEAINTSVPLLRDRLQPVPTDMSKRLAGLVADLDADDYQVRQKAQRKLEELGLDAQPALRKALAGKPSLEMRRRVEQLLEEMEVQTRKSVFGGEFLRALRAVEVLERVGTPEARQVLKTLAVGAPEFCLTRESQAALRRLEATRKP